MKIISGLGKARGLFHKSVLAIGVFDGVHRGHQALIGRAIQKARALRTKAVVMTFAPHPVLVLRPEVPLRLIVSEQFRLKLIADLGVDGCLVVPFTKKFSRLAPETFIRRYLVEYLDPVEIFVGDDFRFGQNRAGRLEDFRDAGRRYGFHVNIIRSVKGRGERGKIGSSRIRACIAEGRLKRAQKFLGRPAAVMGRVIKGDGRGRRFGFPTANIDPRGIVLPPLGVYAVRVRLGKQVFAGMANLGRRPTYPSRNPRVMLEAHIFDFRRSIYGKEIVVEFLRRIRPERIFPSESLLVEELKKDEIKARRILRKFI